MSDKELIEKIEDAYRRVRKIGPDAIYEAELREVLRAAADALEARQPREAIFEDDRDFELEAVLREGFSRAAVPDAATEELERAHDLIDLREFEIDNLHELITELRAERDAALAAIERVLAIHQKRGASWPHSGGVYVCGADNGLWPCPTVAALDGAPEPEEKP